VKNEIKNVSNQELLIELLKRCAHLEAHLETLFMMQCELFAYINKSDSKSLVEKWSDPRVQFLKVNLASLGEDLGKMANQR
jgi:hypothetical protein